MAREYTDQELADSIGKFMRTSITRLYGAMGNRRQDLVFNDVQDAAAGVFLTQADAPYYVVALARDVVLELVQSSLNTLDDLDDTIRATNRRVKPVDSLTALGNARSALAALGGATDARISSLSNIESVPAYRRFEQSTMRFLRDFGGNVRSSGNMVQTPQEARDRLAGLLSSATEQFDEILRRLELLASAVEDFDSLNLPATLSTSIINNSRQVISDHYDTLAALDEQARLSKLRGVILDILTARAVVTGFGALDPTFLFAYFNGMGAPYADATHPATQATIYADTFGPYALYGETQLSVVVDGAYSLTLQLPESYVAQVDGYIVGTYDILASPDPDQNDQLIVRATGETDVPITLTAGTVTEFQVVADINLALGLAHPVGALVYGPQLYLQGEPLQITNVSLPDVTFERLVDDWSELASGHTPQVGDFLFITDEDHPENEGWYSITDVAGLPASFVANSVEVGAQVLSTTCVGDLNRGRLAVRLAFKEAHKLQSIEEQWFISVPVGDAAPDVVQRTLFTLGISPNVTLTSGRTQVTQLVDFINNSANVAVGSSAKLEASSEFQATMYTGPARTEPTDDTRVVCSEGTQTADVSPEPGLDATFIVGSHLSGVGDIVAIRQAALNSVLNYGTIIAVGGNFLTATMQEAVVDELGIVIELGPDLSTFVLPLQLNVGTEGSTNVNDGAYSVIAIGGVDGAGPPFELALDRPLPQHAGTGFLPISLGLVDLGQQRLVLRSLSTLLDTKLEVGATGAAPVFWSTLPQEALGTTSWFSLPAGSVHVDEGDTLELRDTGAQAPTLTRAIARYETNPNLLELTMGLLTSAGTYNLAQGASAPSGRVRKVRRDTYDELHEELESWLVLPLSNSRKYFADLRRLINPLIANSNPTVTAVQDASAKVQQMLLHLGAILGTLGAYTAPRVEQVDRIIDTFREQGADRAVDLLLEARFSTFFNLSQEESSYNSDLQRAIRAVNVNDLPITKYKRNPGGVVLESYEEPDFEYDTTDSEAVEDVDPPGEAYSYPNSAF